MKKLICLILVLTFCCAAAWAQPSSYDRKRISAVQVRGNQAISTATILNRLKLEPGDVFEESALNKELKRLYATGYFSDVFVETDDRPEGVVVVFTVVEKPVIGDIEFRGNSKIKTAKLMKKTHFRERYARGF